VFIDTLNEMHMFAIVAYIYCLVCIHCVVMFTYDAE